ncbi:MAG TPA: hypothetical protein VGA53_03765 [Candidatus Paceibacterota bacterium]
MPTFFARLKSHKPTQVLSKDLQLNELLKDSVLQDLKKRLGPDNEIHAVSVNFHVSTSDKMNGILSFEHPSLAHYNDKVVLITSTRGSILERFLGNK